MESISSFYALAVVPVADVCSPSEVGKFLSRKKIFSLQGKTPRDKVALKLPDDCMTTNNSSGHKVTLTNGVADKVAQHLPRDLRQYPSVNDKPEQQCPSAIALNRRMLYGHKAAKGLWP